MPKINLKPKSPEFDERQSAFQSRFKAKHCDMPGCPNEGDFRAPKDRSLSEHYYFCQMHITEYNRAWNFFEGMNSKEVEDHILSSLYGDRPTWRYDVKGGDPMDELRSKAWEFYGSDENPDDRSSRAYFEQEQNGRLVDHNTPEFEALALFGLEPPLTLDDIKKRYKELAKKYHPDTNQDNPEAEELLKRVNMAYTVLKLAFQNFEHLEK
ncbi:MAG: J domain-containing protein [Pseudomonadota bacterium]